MTQEVRSSAGAVRSVSEESVSAVSDRRLQEAVHRALADSNHPALTGAKVRIDRGRVQLNGLVPSYYTKQIANAAVLNVNGVKGLSNHLSVLPR